MRYPLRTTGLTIALLAFCSSAAVRAQAHPVRVESVEVDERIDESFHYRWHLGNLVGTLAGIFFPSEGDGALTFKTQDNGKLKSELVITSEGHDGEYWRYGALIDTRRRQPIRAWSSYFWRGKSKSKDDPIEQQGVMDIVSGIYSIRRDPPTSPRRIEIWSDGKIYPVRVEPQGPEDRKLPQGTVRTRHYAIRGIDEPGARRWKGTLDLWLSTDAVATPVEIQISRNLADVRLQLQPPSAPAR